MAIEKISLVNLVGNMTDLDGTLLKCLESGYFHPEMVIHSESSHGLVPVEGENPYATALNGIIKLCEELNITPAESNFNRGDISQGLSDEVLQFISEVNNELDELTQKKLTSKQDILQYEQALIQIKHLAGLNQSFDSIFACQYVKVRFGRLPVDSFKKLTYYDNKTFFFFPFDNDGEYYYGVYFAPDTKIAVIDNIFSSLFFERFRVPAYAQGTPDVAEKKVSDYLTAEKANLAEIREQISEIKNKNLDKILSYYCMLRFANTTHEMRRYVATVNNRFYLMGFVPKKERKRFADSFDEFETVVCTDQPFDADPSIEPPVRLKNNWFNKPFEMFTTMYSLPSHNDIDPTPILAFTYTLLFGIMFGDLGQGLVLALLGFILRNKMSLGRIMIRIGFSSSIFGLVYGSVFGFEHLLDPMYKALFGLNEKPIEVFDTSMTNVLLVSAIAIGVILIVLSISINIFNGFRTKNYGMALFSNNGIAGLVLYFAAAYAVVDMMVLQQGVMTTPYVLLLIVLPILCMFLREPLSKLLEGRKDFMPKNIGEFFIENFFELFEYILSYLSNSMSFLRVGGFILSHAGMMAVVMSLSEMLGKGDVNIIVVIIGNAFVMALEGLIVGIQVLRLEFYEMFSRHFVGNGKPYEPVAVKYSLDS